METARGVRHGFAKTFILHIDRQLRLPTIPSLTEGEELVELPKTIDWMTSKYNVRYFFAVKCRDFRTIRIKAAVSSDHPKDKSALQFMRTRQVRAGGFF